MEKGFASVTPGEFGEVLKGDENVMNGFSECDLEKGRLLPNAEADMYGRRLAGAQGRGKYERFSSVLHELGFDFIRLPSDLCMYACEKTAGLLIHRLDEVRS